jgi:hypothetical protein
MWKYYYSTTLCKKGGKSKQSNGRSKQSNGKDLNSSKMANQRIYNLRFIDMNFVENL